MLYIDGEMPPDLMRDRDRGLGSGEVEFLNHGILFDRTEKVLNITEPVTTVTKPGDVLLATHKDLEERTKSGLAQATARAAEAAAKSSEPLPVSNTNKRLLSNKRRLSPLSPSLVTCCLRRTRTWK